MKINVFVAAFMVLVCSSCATERYVAPTISATPRAELELKIPVLAAVHDGRTSGADQNAAASLQSALTKIYGKNLQWIDYFARVPDSRVAVRIRIVTLGSSFGSRLISTSNYATAVQSAQVSAQGPWGPVFGTATGTSTVFGGSFSGEGWWNGAAWIDIEVQDNRGESSNRFIIPIAAEHRESNMLGYASGDAAARKAWEALSAQLTRTMDDILRVVRDSEG